MMALPTLLTALSLVLPALGQDGTRRVGHEGMDVCQVGSYVDPCDLMHAPVQLPAPLHPFIEGLDETALDEEDSDEINGVAFVSQFDFGVGVFPGLLFSPSSPHLHRMSPAVSHAILRC